MKIGVTVRLPFVRPGNPCCLSLRAADSVSETYKPLPMAPRNTGATSSFAVRSSPRSQLGEHGNETDERFRAGIWLPDRDRRIDCDRQWHLVAALVSRHRQWRYLFPRPQGIDNLRAIAGRGILRHGSGSENHVRGNARRRHLGLLPGLSVLALDCNVFRSMAR
jgi:hypothetical protein